MKSLKLFVIALVAIFAVQACKTTDGPEAVTKKFMNHLMAGEYAKASEYGTESTKQMMQMFEALESLGGEGMTDPEVKPEEIKDVTCEEDGDTAICKFDEEGEMAEVTLIKVDGVWLVDMKKENPFGDMDMDSEEEAEWDVEEMEEAEEVEVEEVL